MCVHERPSRSQGRPSSRAGVTPRYHQRVTRQVSPLAATTSLVIAMISFQAGASIAKQLIPVVGAPGTTALRLGISALTLCSRAAAPAHDPFTQGVPRRPCVWAVTSGR